VWASQPAVHPSIFQWKHGDGAARSQHLEVGTNERGEETSTFHDLLAPDADLSGEVPAERLTGVRVDDLELGVAHHRAARAGLHLEGLLGEPQAHGQHRPGLRHAVPLRCVA